MTLDYKKAFEKLESQLKRETEWAEIYEKKKEESYDELVAQGAPKDEFKKRRYNSSKQQAEAQYWFAHGMLNTYKEIVNFIEELKVNDNYQKKEA